MSCARSRTKASPWLPAICWRVIVFVIGENRSFVWIVPDLFFQSQSTDKEVGLSPESVSLAACVAVPLLALERRYPRAALGVFACDLALDPVRPRIGSDMSTRLLSASGRILPPKTASPPVRCAGSQNHR